MLVEILFRLFAPLIQCGCDAIFTLAIGGISVVVIRKALAAQSRYTEALHSCRAAGIERDHAKAGREIARQELEEAAEQHRQACEDRDHARSECAAARADLSDVRTELVAVRTERDCVQHELRVAGRRCDDIFAERDRSRQEYHETLEMLAMSRAERATVEVHLERAAERADIASAEREALETQCRHVASFLSDFPDCSTSDSPSTGRLAPTAQIPLSLRMPSVLGSEGVGAGLASQFETAMHVFAEFGSALCHAHAEECSARARARTVAAHAQCENREVLQQWRQARAEAQAEAAISDEQKHRLFEEAQQLQHQEDALWQFQMAHDEHCAALDAAQSAAAISLQEVAQAQGCARIERALRGEAIEVESRQEAIAGCLRSELVEQNCRHAASLAQLARQQREANAHAETQETEIVEQRSVQTAIRDELALVSAVADGLRGELTEESSRHAASLAEFVHQQREANAHAAAQETEIVEQSLAQTAIREEFAQVRGSHEAELCLYRALQDTVASLQQGTVGLQGELVLERELRERAAEASNLCSTEFEVEVSSFRCLADRLEESEQQLRHYEDGQLCCICLDACRDTVIGPCSHFVLCQGCAARVWSCPICRQIVAGRWVIYST